MAATVTARVQVGRFVFEIGGPAGTRADLASAPGGADPAELAVALSQPGPSDALGAAEESRGDAASVTGRVERSLELDFGILCLAHGTPITSDPHEALRELLQGPPELGRVNRRAPRSRSATPT